MAVSNSVPMASMSSMVAFVEIEVFYHGFDCQEEVDESIDAFLRHIGEVDGAVGAGFPSSVVAVAVVVVASSSPPSRK